MTTQQSEHLEYLKRNLKLYLSEFSEDDTAEYLYALADWSYEAAELLT